MRIFIDSGSLDEIAEWVEHPWISGVTTNPSLVRSAGITSAMAWARELVRLTDKPISIDGPNDVRSLGDNVWRKVVHGRGNWGTDPRLNFTAVCYEGQLGWTAHPDAIVSVFAGRIMDTGRDPIQVIEAAKKTGAQVLWASVREPYNIVMAEDAGCDIVTVPPPILRKWLDWHGKPLEVVAQETIAQFEKDSEGLWDQ